MLALMRLLILFQGVWSAAIGDIGEAVACLGVAILIHRVIKPYMPLYSIVNVRKIREKGDFKPLSRWMVPRNARHVDADTYAELPMELSQHSLSSAREVVKARGYLEVFDYVNLITEY